MSLSEWLSILVTIVGMLCVVAYLIWSDIQLRKQWNEREKKMDAEMELLDGSIEENRKKNIPYNETLDKE